MYLLYLLFVNIRDVNLVQTISLLPGAVTSRLLLHIISADNILLSVISYVCEINSNSIAHAIMHKATNKRRARKDTHKQVM